MSVAQQYVHIVAVVHGMVLKRCLHFTSVYTANAHHCTAELKCSFSIALICWVNAASMAMCWCILFVYDFKQKT